MTGIFKANNPSGNAILFLYAIFLKLPLFLHIRLPQLQALDGILYKIILHFLNPVANNFKPIYSVFTFILLIAQAIGINKIVNDLKLHKQNNYLTGMTYLLITSMFSDWFSFSAPLIVNTLLIWIWAKLCTLYNNHHAKISLFNIGFITSIAAFVYFPSVSFLVLIIAGVAISRPFRLQEWLTIIVGAFTPIYLFASTLYLTNNIGTYHFPGFHFSYPHFFGNKWAYSALILLSLAIAIGFYFTNTNMRRQVVQARKSWQLLFLYATVAALVPFVNASINFSYWILLAVPISPIVASAFLYSEKKVVSQILYWSMFVIFIAVGFLGK
ncbi:MAG: DUF6427 family protein [Ferruginibacter sp.]|nr:hypothetical protein [Ferruginibacter sp.]